MNILYLGSFFPDERVDEIWNNSKGMMVMSANVFQQCILDGFQQLDTNVSLLTLPAIGSFPNRYRQLYFSKSVFVFKGKQHTCGGFLNLTGVKDFGIYCSIKKNVSKWLKSSKENRIVVIYAMFYNYMQAVVDLKKDYPGLKICLIVLDLPEYFDDGHGFRYKLLTYSYKRSYELLSKIDSFVVLTKYMIDVLKVGKKPCLLLEGIFSNNNKDNKLVKKDNGKAILYTGKLDKRFGIVDLLDAFMSIPENDYELWICGDGQDRALVEGSVLKDSRIKYFGLLKREEVLTLQQRATILVNPRRGNEEYTKYSFPSKTMEYMASGTPTVMYRLPGVPEEYFEYLAIVPADSLISLRDTLMTWCSKPANELLIFGEKAKCFIETFKSSKKQVGKLVDFIYNQVNV